ncbi:hypothetical protein IFM58399_07527 [Aspergillus lentulus]|uniref:Regulator of volume decrease after cellular swelling-domain-containing protein n=1 Tax=Aspergillus lentulus TaxID=293939 RepID=A0ABQ1ARY5_ASPLE|nr:uncharacterized protein IFM58399_07527 [Aspergillus lentulus]KAF4151271.1 hypothetical protein CNMCM6069_004186 [Aspergillus lentulus]GFF45362.1 hypothetical protein IFM58399_07527 [Aspergillus lentulus]GFF69091.1 hypothetical protein IFM62136_07489 [Aspergillus lentulus]GFF87008.1 hypothetical protein IFM60648_07899 [Aspergillus lentulus]GFF92484.1 hypothetical protein IFM47457_09200 [Aspergillus lentulus]
MEPLRSAPEASSFVLLADHQSRTPASFHSGPPVLHYHSKQCKLVIIERDLLSTPALNAIRGSTPTANGSNDHTSTAATNNNAAADGEEGQENELVVDGVDVWVTSDKFLLYAPAVAAGVSLPYPSISLHAIQRLRLPGSTTEVQGLYMQIATPVAPGTNIEDDEEESITLTIVPPTGAEYAGGATTAPTGEDAMEDQAEKPEETPVQMMYAAVSACSNLHPDPMEEEDEEGDGEGDSLMQSGFVTMGSADGGLPPPMDGSSGWITAENMHEYFDEEGNWIGGGEEPSLPLGPGAGTVRQREGEGAEGGDRQGEDETKWRRTD